MIKKNKKLLALIIIVLVSFLGYTSWNTTPEEEVFRELYRKKPEIIGAIRHSSEALSKEMVTHFQTNNLKKNYLEAGPGIGSFTDEIIKKMKPHDHLDLVEIEPELCKILEKKYKEQKNVTIFCGSITDWKPDYKYDQIVSGLPFNSFSPKFVKSILDHYVFLAKEEASLSFFEYVFIPTYNKIFSSSKTPKLVGSFIKNHKATSSIVWLNLPPARVYKLKLK